MKVWTELSRPFIQCLLQQNSKELAVITTLDYIGLINRPQEQETLGEGGRCVHDS